MINFKRGDMVGRRRSRSKKRRKIEGIHEQTVEKKGALKEIRIPAA